MKPMPSLRSFCVLAGSSLLAISSASAATLYWDGLSAPGAPGGGAGAWDTTNGTWDTSQVGHSGTVWDNANFDYAVFASTAGAVTLSNNISVGGMRFDTTAYSIGTGANTLSFGATNNNILFNNAIAAATITGTVAGTGNVSLSSAAGTNTAGTLTFSGTSATGWSGTTTIGAGMTLASVSTGALTNKVLSSTTGGITLNGGTIQFTRASNSNIDAINNSAIGVNGGGTFSVTSSNGGASAIENIGTVTVNSGQMNFVQTANNQNNLVLTSLSRGASTTSAVTFSSAAFGTAKFVVTGNGGVATTSGQIFAPWATTGTAANAQTDYAVYNASNEIGSSGIGTSAESTWSTAYALGSNYNVAITAGTATSFTDTRIINTLRKTGGAAQNVTSVASNIVTVTGSAYNNGDVVVVGSGGNIGNLTRETAYYVVNAGVSGAGTFQLAATSGGSALTLGASGGALTGGMNLSTGKNLLTYGILNGSASPLGIGASGTGYISTPTGGGSLYLTAGSGSIVISAPITDNGGAVTVVKNGTGGRLHLSGNNTFTGGLVVNGGGAGSALQLFGTQSFTGGITLNGGGIGENSANSTPYTLASSLNGNAITVNGPSALVVEGTLGSSSTITINPNAVLKLGAGNSALTVQGVVSGSGVLDVNAHNFNSGYSVSLTNSANTFTGDVTYNASNGSNTLSVASIGDAGKVMVGMYANGATKTFALDSTASSALTFNTRQFELVGPSGGHNLIVANNSAQAFNINTALLASGTGTRTMTLSGSAAGLSTFAGNIGNGSLTSLGITKSGTGTWVLRGTNSYTGATTVSGGTLVFQGQQALPSASAISIGGASTTKFLDDGSGVLNFGNSITQTAHNFTTTLFVGNNNTANGGNSSGTTTGSTIALGAFTFYDHTDTFNRTLSVTGANGYSLQLSDVTLFAQGGNVIGGGRDVGIISPSTARVTITGNVIQRSGKGIFDANRRAYLDYLQLDGTATGNLISGTIMDAADFTNSSNANAVALNVIKRNATGDWSLTGANTYTGRTQIDQGTLIVNSLTNAGVAGTLGKSTSAAGLVLNGGTLKYAPVNAVGGAGDSTDRNFSLLTSSTIDASGTGALVFNAPTGSVISPDVTGLTFNAAGSNKVLTGLASTANLTAGMRITGTGIAANSTIASIDSASQITLNSSANVTAGTGVAASMGYAARTLTLTGTNTDANTIAGVLQDSSATGAGALSITKSGNGRWALSGDNTYSGATTISAGTLQLGNGGTTGALAGTSSITNNGNLTINRSNAFTQASGLNGKAITGSGSLTQSGAGITTLSLVNTYSGTTTVNQGTLEVSAGNINGTSSVAINGGEFKYGSATALTKNVALAGGTFRYNSVANYTGTLTQTGGTIAGTNWNGSLDNQTIATGEFISPGNSPGTSSTGSQTWAGGGTYVWEINSTLGTAGLDPGWDLVNGTGVLTITAGIGTEFTIDITSLTALNAAGLVSNFDDTLNYNWLIADFLSITGFDETDFILDDTAFANTYAGQFGIALGNTGSIGGDASQIYLTYTAIPEPNVAALIGGLGVLMLLRRRR